MDNSEVAPFFSYKFFRILCGKCRTNRSVTHLPLRKSPCLRCISLAPYKSAANQHHSTRSDKLTSRPLITTDCGRNCRSAMNVPFRENLKSSRFTMFPENRKGWLSLSLHGGSRIARTSWRELVLAAQARSPKDNTERNAIGSDFISELSDSVLRIDWNGRAFLYS